jgi:hypothetical protein
MDVSAEAWSVVGIAIVGWIFSAGILYANVRQLRKDMNGIGRKHADTQKENDRLRELAVTAADRRYHNVSLAIMLISPNAREKEVCEFLKEGK